MLPNLIIIGAQKCGTTSLHYYLSLHPHIVMSKEKELDFFVAEKRWPKGLAWYESCFTGAARVYGESSPNYTNYPYFRGVPARMHAVVPAAKLIYVVRDPLERMISSYIHAYSEGRENRPIEAALRHPERYGYVHRSLYSLQLEQYLAYYPVSQMLVMTAEELQEQRRSALRRVFAFLQVDPDFYCRRYEIRRHPSQRKRRKTAAGVRLAQTAPAQWLARLPQRFRWPFEDLLYWPVSRPITRPTLSATLQHELKARLQDDVVRLRALTGHDFARWRL